MQVFKTVNPIERSPLSRMFLQCIFALSVSFSVPGCGNASDEPKDLRALFTAIRLGDVETIESALKENPQIVKEASRVDQTLLHKAAFENKPDLIRLLVDAGADTEARDILGFTPLYTALSTGATEAAKALIGLGADFRTRHRFQHEGARPDISVLDHAAGQGNVEIVNLLLKKGVPVVDTKHPNLDTPLHRACRDRTWMKMRGLEGNQGNYLVIDALMKHMDDVNVRNFQRHTPLHIAAQNGAADTIKHLLKKYPKVEVNAEAPGGKTALHFAVGTRGSRVPSENRVASIRALLDGGAKLLPDSNGQTPLDLARETGDRKVIVAFEELEKQPADSGRPAHADGQPDNGRAPTNSGSPATSPDADLRDVFRAAQKGDIEIVKSALKDDPKLVNARDRFGQTLLHTAVKGNQPEVIRYLVMAGADLENRNALGHTPLYDAVFPYATRSAKTLIELGADYRARVKLRHEGAGPGLSVLDHAATRGNVEIVNLLLMKGVPVVDPKYPNLNTPLHFACMHPASTPFPEENKGNRLVVDELMKHTQDVNVRNFLELTPLHMAAQMGAVNTIKHLLKTYPKVEFNAKAQDGKTALHFAVSTPDLDWVKSEDRAATIRTLLKAGAKLLPDSSGQTPLDLAREIGDKSVIAAFDEDP